MSEDLRQRLAGQIMHARWHDLLPHSVRGVLFVVRKDLNLLDVAVAAAEDDVEHMKLWLADGGLRKPSKIETEVWAADDGEGFNFVICSPFVLAQEHGDGSLL